MVPIKRLIDLQTIPIYRDGSRSKTGRHLRACFAGGRLLMKIDLLKRIYFYCGFPLHFLSEYCIFMPCKRDH